MKIGWISDGDRRATHGYCDAVPTFRRVPIDWQSPHETDLPGYVRNMLFTFPLGEPMKTVLNRWHGHCAEKRHTAFPTSEQRADPLVISKLEQDVVQAPSIIAEGLKPVVQQLNWLRHGNGKRLPNP
ncbi:predicted protein [Histoplasma capsulatum G186AR]|uniref:Uncharacterized protein n=1 Tax=Ajellomyces capsulatus (strain G186AR / H82 / ATCC MYA-2454 / RMSCC 2432) TaxID=447093 RepID=C0NHR3_AJECG|nr:uncharacterized protein HCBG_02885 [Histoplasma capsulatum G186AR]EEH09348.1 predicted protein [Histoplasma capsulatum G186AR]